jgi:hypothetical protein
MLLVPKVDLTRRVQIGFVRKNIVLILSTKVFYRYSRVFLLTDGRMKSQRICSQKPFM